jgi:hypothetical protein
MYPGNKPCVGSDKRIDDLNPINNATWLQIFGVFSNLDLWGMGEGLYSPDLPTRFPIHPRFPESVVEDKVRLC